MFFVDFLAFYGKRQHGVTVRYPINLIPESGMSNCSTSTKFKKC